MGTIQLRQRLHEYIEIADDRIIRLMYGLIVADMEEDASELPDEHKKILDERMREYRLNPQEVLTWEEIKARYSSHK